MEKIKVVWVCCFSNTIVRNHLKKRMSILEKVLRRFIPNNGSVAEDDFALWNTRGIKEIKKNNNIELHVISHANNLKDSIQSFVLDGVHYYFYRDEADDFITKVKTTIWGKPYRHIKGDRIINGIIDNIKPDLIHIIGAENYYSSFILDRSDSIPSIVYLQTLLCEPGFKDRYKLLRDDHFALRVDIEKKVIRKCDYIGTESALFKEIILQDVKHDAVFFNMNVATNVEVEEYKGPKVFDFVYFANGISKACDFAIEAFAIASHKYPNLKLDIIGQYSEDYKKLIDDRIQELGIEKQNVSFEGSYPSHDDVIKQVQKSKFALLPFKVDYNPTTIPEAMSCGLPVVSTMTEGISVLYSNENNILLSRVGDHAALANNMVRLIEDENLANSLKRNAYAHLSLDSNSARINHWVEVYQAIVNNRKNLNSIPESLFFK